MTACGTSTTDRFGSAALMNDGTGWNRPAFGGGDEARRVEAAGPVDAQNAPTRSLQNAQNAFRTATTRITIVIHSQKSVTHVAGQICYLGRRPGKLKTALAAAATLSFQPGLPVDFHRERGGGG